MRSSARPPNAVSPNSNFLQPTQPYALNLHRIKRFRLMKSKLIALLTGIFLTCSALSAEDTRSSIAFSNPAEPGRFSVRLSNGEITIKGGDHEEVTVTSSAPGGPTGRTRDDGLRVLSASSTFTLEEHDNVVILDYGSFGWAEDSEFKVTLPRNTHIDVEIGFGGEIEVVEIDGDVVIKNLNGEVELSQLGGGAIVESANGEITASFTKMSPDRPLSFSSMNGKISLRLPADAAADVRFRTHNGSILTNFTDEELVTKTTSVSRHSSAPVDNEFARAAAEVAREAVQMAQEIAQEVRIAVQEAKEASKDGQGHLIQAPRAPRAPRMPSIPAMAGGKVIAGTLNGGGTILQVATMNGDIVIRKNKE